MERKRNKLKIWIGQKVLDTAEKLPTFNGGFIENLQDLRKRSRAESEEDLKRNSIPDGTEVSLDSVVLSQVYPIEDFDLLTKAVERTFGKKHLGFPSRTIEDLRKSENQLWGGSYTFFGHIAHAKSGFFYPVGYRYSSTLSKEIRQITVEGYRVLPSTFVVVFKLHFEESFSKELRKIHARKYIGEVEFSHWAPIGRWAYGCSWGDADSERARAVDGYIRRVQSSADSVIKKFFPAPRVRRGMPLYELREFRIIEPLNIPQAGGNVVPENKENPSFRIWGGSLGLSNLSFAAFTDGSTHFMFGDEFGDQSRSHLLVRITSASEKDKREFLGVGEALIPALAIRSFLKETSDQLGKLRVAAYRRVTRSTRLYTFKPELRLHARLQVQRFLAERLKAERGVNRLSFRSLSSNLEKLTRTQFGNGTLADRIEREVAGTESNLELHANLAAELFESYVGGRNLQLNYRLARRVLWLNLIVAIVTVLVALGNYDQSATKLRKFKHYLVKRLHAREVKR